MARPLINQNPVFTYLIPYVNRASAGSCLWITGSGTTNITARKATFRMIKKASVGTPVVPNRPRSPTNYFARFGALRVQPGTLVTKKVAGTLLSPCTGAYQSGFTWSEFPQWCPYYWTWPEENNFPYSTTLYSSVVSDLLAAVKEGNGTNLSVAFAQRKQTEKQILSSAERVRGDTEHFKKTNRREWERLMKRSGIPPGTYSVSKGFLKKNHVLPADSLLTQWGRRVPEEWIAMQYGWKPMMSDLFNSLEAVDRAQQANDLLYSVRKSSGWRKMVERVYDCQTSGNGLRFTLTEEELCTVKVYYQIQSSVLASLASVGLANPASIVWELVPYSFVIDWFLPLGNWFNTFDAALGKTFYGGYVSQGMKHPTTVGTHILASNVQTLGALSGYYEYECFNRTVLSSFPVPGFPGFKNPFSPGHVANGLALMANAFTRKYT